MKKQDKMYYIHKLAYFIYKHRKDYYDFELQSFSDYDTIRMFGDWWIKDRCALEKIKFIVYLFEKGDNFKALDLFDDFIGNNNKTSMIELYKRFI